MPWDRMVLHARMATTDQVGSAFTHGWTSRAGVSVFHNGILRAADARTLPVDSQALVRWLEHGGIRYTLRRLEAEPFANVFLVDAPRGQLYVSRTASGQLHTNRDQTQFSTHPIPALGVTEAVPARFLTVLDFAPERHARTDPWLNWGYSAQPDGSYVVKSATPTNRHGPNADEILSWEDERYIRSKYSG